MKHFWRTTMNPAWYHGHDRKPPFFEGWYFKLIDRPTNNKLAIIPGIILGQEEHAFVQVLDGTTGASFYHTYPVTEFSAARDRFDVQIGSNYFTASRIQLAIERPEQTLHGELRFESLTPWPVTIASPGIMGWYAWVPFMECYHGVVSLDHSIAGQLRIDDRTINFDGGRGYTEKDWGRSFPSAWIWLQSNHFRSPTTSLTASIAMIPWVRQAFRGFIIGLWHDQTLYRFATYTGARTERLTVDEQGINWVVADRRHRLAIQAWRGNSGVLRGPSKVDMGKRVSESIDATVSVVLTRLAGRQPATIFAEEGRHAGLEIHNASEELVSR